MYKKVNLKFSYDKYRREDRLEQTLKTRESSRFKRLSSIRNLENSDLLQSDESSKVVENEHHKLNSKEEKKIQKHPPSRLEMLRIWKADQQKRREEEMKKKPPPFKVGKAAIKKPAFNKGPQSLNMTAKSETSRLANPKILPKSTNVASVKITPSGIKTTKISSLQKSSNQVSSTMKTFSKSEKAAPIKASSKIGLKENSSSCLKPKIYVSHPLKPTSMIPSKPTQKPSAETLKSIQSRKLPEVPRSVPGIPKGVPPKTSSKGIPVVRAQNKIQPPQTSRQPAIGIPKLPAKPCVKTPVKSCVKTPVKSCVKTPVKSYVKAPVKRIQIKEPSISTRTNGSQKGLHTGVATEISDNPKKTDDTITIASTGAEGVQACEVRDKMELTFNSDLSVIKPSFAPDNFVFEPPALLCSLRFGDDEDEDDDDDDPFVVLEKYKYLHRTSTPEKLPESNSSSKRCSTSCSETSQKLPEKSANDDVTANENVQISDLISTTLLPLEDEVIPKDINDKPVDHDAQTTTETAVAEFGEPSENRFCKENTLDNADDSNAVKRDTVVAAVEMSNHETGCSVPETAEMERVEPNDAGVAEENSVETASNIDNHETQCDAVVDTLKEASVDEVPLDDSLGIIDFKNTVKDASKMHKDNEIECNNELVDSLKNVASPDNSPLDESLGIIDLNIESPLLENINLMKLEDDRVFKSDTAQSEVIKPSRKSGAIPKRASILKSILTLEAISEVSECDTPWGKAKSVDSERDDVGATPRRSKRLSGRKLAKGAAGGLEKIIDVESPQYSPSFTPRRSTRLQKLVMSKLEEAEDSASSLHIPRRSMRLIDLNTPERKEKSKTDLTFKMEKLNLNESENMDPQVLLENLESPDVNKSRKVSLLYTPERKRISMRKSMRGDLMSFSPA